MALLIAGCTTPSAPQPGGPSSPPAAVQALPDEPLTFTNLTATLVALPVVGGEATLTFDVPPGSAWLGATLKWRTRGSNLTLQAIDPAGQAQGETRSLAGTGPRAPARLDWWAAQPKAGKWTFLVRGAAAAQEPLVLQLHTLPRPPRGMHVAEAANVPEGRFVEVNTNLKQGATLDYAWSSAEQVLFNIHTHRGNQVIDYVNTNATGGRGNFTAEQEGLYSLLWEVTAPALAPPSTRAVALSYRIDGTYDLHSASG